MSRHDDTLAFALLGAVLVGAVSTTELITGGREAARFLACFTACGVLIFVDAEHRLLRAARLSAELICAGLAVWALSTLSPHDSLMARGLAVVCALWILERGASLVLVLTPTRSPS